MSKCEIINFPSFKATEAEMTYEESFAAELQKIIDRNYGRCDNCGFEYPVEFRDVCPNCCEGERFWNF